MARTLAVKAETGALKGPPVASIDKGWTLDKCKLQGIM